MPRGPRRRHFGAAVALCLTLAVGSAPATVAASSSDGSGGDGSGQTSDSGDGGEDSTEGDGGRGQGNEGGGAEAGQSGEASRRAGGDALGSGGGAGGDGGGGRGGHDGGGNGSAGASEGAGAGEQAQGSSGGAWSWPVQLTFARSAAVEETPPGLSYQLGSAPTQTDPPPLVQPGDGTGQVRPYTADQSDAFADGRRSDRRDGQRGRVPSTGWALLTVFVLGALALGAGTLLRRRTSVD